MTAALDLGSTEFRSLRRQDQKLIARRIPAVYAVLDDSQASRQLLERSHIPFAATHGSLIVVGDAALETSTLLSRPLVPLLHGGKLPAGDPVARQVCAWLIESLLPDAVENDLCLLSLPRSSSEETADEGMSTPRFLEHVVQLRGYRTAVMQPATALALAELEDLEFTGACVSIGAESVSLSIVHLGTPLVEGQYHKGSRDICERFAHAHRKYLWDHSGNSYLNLPAIEKWLRNGEISLAAPRNDEETWLADAYQELLLSSCFSFRRKLARCHHPLLREPLTLVISGGACQLSGMLDVVVESLKLSGIPLRISEVRRATFDPYSVARGLLIQATLETGESLAPLPTVEAA